MEFAGRMGHSRLPLRGCPGRSLSGCPHRCLASRPHGGGGGYPLCCQAGWPCGCGCLFLGEEGTAFRFYSMFLDPSGDHSAIDTRDRRVETQALPDTRPCARRKARLFATQQQQPVFPIPISGRGCTWPPVPSDPALPSGVGPAGCCGPFCHSQRK